MAQNQGDKFTSHWRKERLMASLSTLNTAVFVQMEARAPWKVKDLLREMMMVSTQVIMPPQTRMV